MKLVKRCLNKVIEEKWGKRAMWYALGNKRLLGSGMSRSKKCGVNNVRREGTIVKNKILISAPYTL